MLKRTRLWIVLSSLCDSEEYCTFLVTGHCSSESNEEMQKQATFAVESFARTEKWRLAESRPFCRRALSWNKLTRVRRLIQSFRDHLSSGHGPYFTAGDGITAQRFSCVFGSGAFSTATSTLAHLFHLREQLDESIVTNRNWRVYLRLIGADRLNHIIWSTTLHH
ncbi:hypothetical protein T4E_8407 [Trichinella pseudospiralis]|uniref:Uncharacterized protein n=1 Tax=Trichinella pseudospiralis TaxID=6337 RepID=A0A0V1FR06_TRIPS|nr:hypothetical protein T4E_8407 [Trichinella pseudospiralis]KRY88472.1 hypothetical protein T4D_2061 [Trichinella pseudospiralis]